MPDPRGWERRVAPRRARVPGGMWVAVVLAGGALGVTLSSCDRKPSTPAAKPEAPPVAVVVTELIPRTVAIPAEFVGRTEAVQTVDLRARVEGVLERVLFREGTEVGAGQVLFEIERRPYEAGLQKARAQLARAQADLTRAQEQVEVLRARADLARAQADLTRAQDRVTVVRAQAGLEQRLALHAKARQDVARLEPLAKAQAIPQQDLDNALAAQDVTKADVDAARAALQDTELSYRVGLLDAQATVQAEEAKLKDSELGQRIGIEQAKAAVEAGRSAVTQAELDLSYTTIRAPVAGLIGRLAVDQGNLVGRGESTLLATMSTIDPIKVVLTLSETEYLRFARQAATVAAGSAPPPAGARAAPVPQRPENEPAQLDLVLADGSPYPHKGRVVTLERSLDQKTGTLLVEAHFPNPEKLIRPGQFGRVRVAVEARTDTLLVPQRAVQEQQGVRTVLVVGPDNKVAQRTILVSERVGDDFIVRDGLQTGDRVIVEGVQKARPGATVQPTTASPGGASPGGAPPAAAPTRP